MKKERSNTIKEDEEKERANINAEIADYEKSLVNARSRLAKIGKALPRKNF